MGVTRIGVTAAAVAAAALWSAATLAEDSACDARYFANLQGTYVDFDDRAVTDQTGTGLRLGLGRRNCAVLSGQSHWELDLNWNSIDDTPDDDTQSGLMLHRLRVSGSGGWRPFWQAGVGAQQEEILGDKRTFPALELGVGLLRNLGDGGFALRLDVAIQGLYTRDAPDDERIHHDGRVALGLTLPFGSRAMPAPDSVPAAPLAE